MDKEGFFPLFEEIDYNTEAAGVDFSPDGMVMYVAVQELAIWQFWREDRKPFDAKTGETKYVTYSNNVYDTAILLSRPLLKMLQEIWLRGSLECHPLFHLQWLIALEVSEPCRPVPLLVLFLVVSTSRVISMQ
jgi:hypothetical protein